MLERVVQGLRVRGSWRPNINGNILTPNLWPSRCVFLVLWCSTGGPEATLLGDGFLYGILSASSPVLNSSGPKGLFGLMWLFLPHLVSNSTACNSTGRRTQLNYIIVRCPLDLWNRMFNRHQAEITVMQFTGHSLPVHQSMSVPLEFFSSSHFISQFPPTRFPPITAIRMCHFLPVHQLEWHFARAEGQNITCVYMYGVELICQLHCKNQKDLLGIYLIIYTEV